MKPKVGFHKSCLFSRFFAQSRCLKTKHAQDVNMSTFTLFNFSIFIVKLIFKVITFMIVFVLAKLICFLWYIGRFKITEHMVEKKATT